VTFVLPSEYALFLEEFKLTGGVWIMKPIGSAQGKGIFLFSRLSEISEWRQAYRYRGKNGAADGKEDKGRGDDVEAYVVQRYISNPYLIGQKKFDLRVYCLVTSFSPIQAWLHRSGFARFSHSRYSSDPRDIANNFMHLTNVAIQKTSDNYDARSGGKWDIRSLKLFMIGQFGREKVDELFWRIQMLILRSLFAVQQVCICCSSIFFFFGDDDDDDAPFEYICAPFV
jgi:tubulin polyglutamylase TTLL9